MCNHRWYHGDGRMDKTDLAGLLLPQEKYIVKQAMIESKKN